MKINQEELKEAFRQAQDIATYSLENKIDSSEEWETEMEWEKLYEEGRKRNSKRYHAGFRIVIAILVVLTIGVTSVFSVEASRKVIMEWFTKQGEKMDEFHFTEDGSDEYVPPQTIEKIYEPSYIPDGFKLTNEEKDDLGIYQEYQKGKKYIQFEQQVINVSVSIDSEKVKREDILINGNKGQLNYKKGTTILIWTSKDYIFMISGNLKKETVIKIAESVKEK